jgi:hypothetical protein
MVNVLVAPAWFNVKLPIVLEPVVKRKVPSAPLIVLSIVKSVADVVEIVPVVITNAADPVEVPLNN